MNFHYFRVLTIVYAIAKDWLSILASSISEHFFAALDTRQAAELTGIAAHTLECWRRDGEGPPYVKLGRLMKYRRIDLDAFMESNMLERFRPTTACDQNNWA
jgi:predicted DNA-binding transcriptional regulator AlpA